jgi:hypothetical protein
LQAEKQVNVVSAAFWTETVPFHIQIPLITCKRYVMFFKTSVCSYIVKEMPNSKFIIELLLYRARSAEPMAKASKQTLMTGGNLIEAAELSFGPSAVVPLGRVPLMKS